MHLHARTMGGGLPRESKGLLGTRRRGSLTGSTCRDAHTGCRKAHVRFGQWQHMCGSGSDICKSVGDAADGVKVRSSETGYVGERGVVAEGNSGHARSCTARWGRARMAENKGDLHDGHSGCPKVGVTRMLPSCVCSLPKWRPVGCGK